MKVVTPQQMQEIDRTAMEQYGIPGMVLMENAGRSVADQVLRLSGRQTPVVVLFAGKGNNGGDAMVAARHLFNGGASVKVFLVGSAEDVKGDSLANMDILARMGIPVVQIKGEDQVTSAAEALERAQVVVDGIFGTGLRGEVGGIAADVIEMINKSGLPVVAIDIPSGIDGCTGQVLGKCIRADVTVTFGYAKVGLFQYPGAGYTGKVVVSDISIPRQIADQMDIRAVLLTGGLVRDMLPALKPDAHKGSRGRALLIGGSQGMTGAISLACTGCLRSGAGLIKAAVPAGLNSIMEVKLTEVMTVPVGDESSMWFDRGSVKYLAGLLDKADAVAIGPGIGVDDQRTEMVDYVVTNSPVALVIDADALNCIAANPGMLRKASAPVIVTPHPGEMSRLMGCSVADVQRNRVKAAKDFSKTYRVITVLKGANSVIADPNGNIYINRTGNQGMASGGMGDVLTGVITSLLCQGMEPVEAACSAVYLHGLAGDLAASRHGCWCITASEVADCIPEAIRQTQEIVG
jgi:hydroxyethylthiazole kinase-like uncharacterized protein yjeF